MSQGFPLSASDRLECGIVDVKVKAFVALSSRGDGAYGFLELCNDRESVGSDSLKKRANLLRWGNCNPQPFLGSQNLPPGNQRRVILLHEHQGFKEFFRRAFTA